MPSQFPSFVAGQKITADLLASGQPRLVYKAGNTARTTTTPVADPDLTISVEANAIYVMRGLLLFSATVASDNVSIDWNAPAGASGHWQIIGVNVGATSDASTPRTIGTSLTSARTYGTDDGGASNPVGHVVTALIITAGTAGTYELVWNLNTATGTTTLYADSFMTLQRFA